MKLFIIHGKCSQIIYRTCWKFNETYLHAMNLLYLAQNLKIIVICRSNSKYNKKIIKYRCIKITITSSKWRPLDSKHFKIGETIGIKLFKTVVDAALI